MPDTTTTSTEPISVRGGERARTRYHQALWYAWGRQDAGDAALAAHRTSHAVGDDFAFAEMAAREAQQYDEQQRTSLENIGAQYRRFVDALPAGA
jgi:hypothetical protein